MRLLSYDDAGQLQVSEPFSEQDIPPYAILSHTWGADRSEVTFKDLQDGFYSSKEGFRKMEFCAQQALRDGLKHFWVDTCCIDKSSSAELSKSIISMYRWYQHAQVCYVYLSDVSTEDAVSGPHLSPQSPVQRHEASFRKSRWFTRGWTLQELLAPRDVVFYSREGEFLGTKLELAGLLEEITRIPEQALLGQKLSHFSIDERMRWAKSRVTKEVEDIAYCLMGIFGTCIPLMYGEREQAFKRLRLQIALQVVSRPGKQGIVFDRSGRRAEIEGCRSLQPEIDNLRQASENYGHRREDSMALMSRETVSMHTTTTLKFLFGKAFVRESRSGASPWIGTKAGWTHRSRLSATFVPSPLFWQTMIVLQAAWTARHDLVSTPSLSLQFLDVIQDSHPIINAAVRGNCDTLRNVLKSSEMSVLCCTLDGWTPLHYAAAYGNLGACRFLIEQGASLHATGVRGISPLHLAAHFGHLGVFKTLVEAGIDPDDYHENGLNAIFELLSIGAGRQSVTTDDFLKWLFHVQNKFLADVRAKDHSKRSILYHIAYPPGQAFKRGQALDQGQVGAIKSLLEGGAFADELDINGTSPLHEACRDGRTDLVTILLSAVSDIDTVDTNESTALYCAVVNGDIELIAMLINAGAAVNASKLGDPLIRAASFGLVDIVQLLLQHGAGACDEHVDDAFELACFKGQIEIVQYFWKHARNQLEARLALNRAVQNPNVKSAFISELIDIGAPIDEVDNFGKTPLATSVLRGDVDCVRLLLDRGANADREFDIYERKQTLLEPAIRNGDHSMVSLLLDRRAQTKEPRDALSTLAKLAEREGDDDMVKLLTLREGSTHLEQHGETVLQSCSSNSPYKQDTVDYVNHIRKRMFIAFEGGYSAIVDKLLRLHYPGALPDILVRRYMARAIQSGNRDIARILIEAVPDLGSASADTPCRDNPLFAAVVCYNPELEMLQCMLKKGASVHDACRCHDQTPLLWCLDQSMGYGDTDTVRTLLNAGSDVHAVDKDGRTALGIAAQTGNLDIVVALVDTGSDLETLCSQTTRWPDGGEQRQFRTPLSWAALYGYEDIVKFLVKRGANWRSVRNDPSVWYTHRYVVESFFPQRISDYNTPRIIDLDPDEDEDPPRTITPTDQIPSKSPRRTKKEKFPVLRKIYVRIQNWLDRLHFLRLEVAVLLLVTFLLTLRSLGRYLWSILTHDRQAIRILALMILIAGLAWHWRDGS